MQEASVNPNAATYGSLSCSTCSFLKIGQGALRLLFAILMLIGSMEIYYVYWYIDIAFRFFIAGWISFVISIFLEYYNGLSGYDDKRRRFYVAHGGACVCFLFGSFIFIFTRYDDESMISYEGFWIAGGILNAASHGYNGLYFCKDNIVLKISHILGVIGSLVFGIAGILEFLLKEFVDRDIVFIVGSSIYLLHSVFYCWGVISAKEPITQDEEVEATFNGVWPSQPSNDGGSIAQRLEELASIKHILTESEFEAKKREILASV